jgi:hypothetical protein
MITGPAATDAAKRDPRGRWLPGCSGGPGSGIGHRMATLRARILDSIEPQQVESAMRKLLILGLRDGDVAALRVWLSYAVGAPQQQIELTAGEGQPINLAVIIATVLDALGDDDDARIRVAGAFRKLGVENESKPPALEAAKPAAAQGETLDDDEVGVMLTAADLEKDLHKVV